MKANFDINLDDGRDFNVDFTYEIVDGYRRDEDIQWPVLVLVESISQYTHQPGEMFANSLSVADRDVLLGEIEAKVEEGEWLC